MGDKNQSGSEIAHGAIIRESKRNVFGEGHLADCIILQWLTRYGKPTIAWRDHTGNDVAWLAGHEFLDEELLNLHKHISLETSDISGQLQTRFGIGYGADQVDIQVRSVANFDLLDALLLIQSSGTNTVTLSRKLNTNFNTLNFQTNLIDKWAIQQRNVTNDDLFIRDTANGITHMKFKHGASPIVMQKTRNAIPTDADLENESTVFYLDQGANLLKFKCKYSDGTVHIGSVAVV